jgi:type III pantothenate kinase
MTPVVVADVGNTRIKWGRCAAEGVVDQASLPADDPDAWQRQLEAWKVVMPALWVLAGVHPDRLARLERWLAQRGDGVTILRNWLDLGLSVLLDRPERVGIDRLLNALAARDRGPGPAVLIDAGSAVTVDWLDEAGCFRGGAILPGFRLMAQALHAYTALLPLIEPPSSIPQLPGRSTIQAIEAGVYWAAAGGVRALVAELVSQSSNRPRIFLTGGDGPLLLPVLDADVVAWPTMTLEGILQAAKHLHPAASAR